MTIRNRAWTDHDLAAAVTESTSYRGVMRRLGFKNGSHRYLQQRIASLGLDTSHFEHHPQKRLCPDNQLRRVVAESNSYSDVLRALGVELKTVNFRRLRRRIGLLGLDTLHFRRARSERGRTRSWTDDDLRAAVATSFGYAQTIRALGLIPAGGNYVQVQRRMRELELDTTHFRGHGWNVEGKFIKRAARPLAEVLVAGRWTGSHQLKLRL